MSEDKENKKSPKRVMISSTALDLPEHRKELMDACLRMGMLPVMMEHLTAGDTDAVAQSLALVNGADIYLGVFAYRYGYVPDTNNPEQLSITEMEYNRAVARGIPRLIFFMDKSHPITAADTDEDTKDPAEAARRKVKLDELKKRAGKERVVAFFKSPTDLRAHVIQAFGEYRKPDLTAFHYVSDIPAPPEPFIAHPYTLLQTHRLVGRQPELNLLTDWVAKPESAVYQARILNVVAIGGMGKSALTWKWFNEIAPQEMKPLAGRMWWSFYESDATFENFVTRALAYVTRRPLVEVEQIPAPEREAQLLSALDREPFLIVLDGLERMLIAYARMDAAHLSDDDYDRQTANYVANASGLPASAAQSFTGQHRLRKTADPRAGAFLRKLTTVRAARVLVSTRLYPADLQMVTGEALGTCFAVFLPGLAEDDALELWRAFGAKGSRDQLLPVFRRVEDHPLLIQSLAGEVARYRRAPGDFDAWLKSHPDFNPFRDIPLVQVKSHVLEFALRSLSEQARQVLQVIAAFRMPASYDTLTALLIGKAKPCASEQKLDAVLAELEDRGLVGWDKRANRYDLHPIVRGVVWSGLGDDGRRGVYTNLHTHLKALPPVKNWKEVRSVEQLTATIELYNALIGLKRYDDAYQLFDGQLDKSLLNRLGKSRLSMELLKMLFLEEDASSSHLTRTELYQRALDMLGNACDYHGEPINALSYYRLAISLAKQKGDTVNTSHFLCDLADVLFQTGSLCEAKIASYQALSLNRLSLKPFGEAVSLLYSGRTLAAIGNVHESDIALQRGLKMLTVLGRPRAIGGANEYLAKKAIWIGDFPLALTLAKRALALATAEPFARYVMRATWVLGTSALYLNDFATANPLLLTAVTRTRELNLVREELPALIALAELRRREGKPDEARTFLDDVWGVAERGPYPLFHADACNVLAQLERDAGNTILAIEAATQAYWLAWCDGPPFAYHWGLEAARKHLRELGAPEPELPPFDSSKYEPMPEVEIDPPDEFHDPGSADR